MPEFANTGRTLLKVRNCSPQAPASLVICGKTAVNLAGGAEADIGPFAVEIYGEQMEFTTADFLWFVAVELPVDADPQPGERVVTKVNGVTIVDPAPTAAATLGLRGV